MLKPAHRVLRWFARSAVVAAGLLLAVLYAFSTSWPDAEIWHDTPLDEEFSRGRLEEVGDFSGYLKLEERLFRQLQSQVYARTPRGPDHRLERFSTGSAADPTLRDVNWNRSFELDVETPRGGVLLLHGLSDSPYSLRSIGQTLQGQGYQVLGLRLPGHGTAPSGLLEVDWRDMAAAVALAAQHLAGRAPGKPLHIIGYSTGAALAVDYALEAELDKNRPTPASLVLLSPAIGVSPAAALAKWNRRLSYLPGLSRLAWLDMMPEFNPYQYNSFAVNAADLVYQLTSDVAARVAKRAGKTTAPLPPILVLKSTVDATVSTRAVVDHLLIHLAPEQHEFVLFDINRRAVNASILVSDPGPLTREMWDNAGLPFTLTVVGNADPESSAVVARQKAPFSSTLQTQTALDAVWPPGTLSLSHVALPFPPDDPLYGRSNPGNPEEIFLGVVAIHGERGLLRFSSDWLIRLRHNPFYGYAEQRIIDWLAAAQNSG